MSTRNGGGLDEKVKLGGGWWVCGESEAASREGVGGGGFENNVRLTRGREIWRSKDTGGACLMMWWTRCSGEGGDCIVLGRGVVPRGELWMGRKAGLGLTCLLIKLFHIINHFSSVHYSLSNLIFLCMLL